MNRDRNPLFMEEVLIRKLAISKHLLLIFVLDMWEEFTSTLLGRFECSDTKGSIDGTVALQVRRRREVGERSCHLAPVTKFNSALAKTAARNDCNRVSSATVDLDEGYQALA